MNLLEVVGATGLEPVTPTVWRWCRTRRQLRTT